MDEALTRELAETLLGPQQHAFFKTAEGERTWAVQKDIEFFPDHHVNVELRDKVLMRTYDYQSGSQPDGDDGRRMSARANRMLLSDRSVRENSLEIHANHGTWTDTPFISFTSSPAKLSILAHFRQNNRERGNQTIVVIDPQIRLALGLPILKMQDEMDHYNVSWPYSSSYGEDHYLCLWEVTPDEIVGIWDWDDLSAHPEWYEDVILPALEKNRRTVVYEEPPSVRTRVSALGQPWIDDDLRNGTHSGTPSRTRQPFTVETRAERCSSRSKDDQEEEDGVEASKVEEENGEKDGKHDKEEDGDWDDGDAASEKLFKQFEELEIK